MLNVTLKYIKYIVPLVLDDVGLIPFDQSCKKVIRMHFSYCHTPRCIYIAGCHTRNRKLSCVCTIYTQQRNQKTCWNLQPEKISQPILNLSNRIPLHTITLIPNVSVCCLCSVFICSVHVIARIRYMDS